MAASRNIAAGHGLTAARIRPVMDAISALVFCTLRDATLKSSMSGKVRRFRADLVVDVMRTHPLVLIGGILQENPFFVPPDKFLAELRERGTTRVK
jgi:hypothetical protein